MSDRLSDRAVGLYASEEGDAAWVEGRFVITTGGSGALVKLAREVLAARKLIADLRAMPYDYITRDLLVQMINAVEAGL